MSTNIRSGSGRISTWASSSTASHYTFRHLGGSDYDILFRNSVEFCGRAYGVSAFVINKHKTTMMTKQVPSIERIDKMIVESTNQWVWIAKNGSNIGEVGLHLTKLLNDLMKHHEIVLVKMITE